MGKSARRQTVGLVIDEIAHWGEFDYFHTKIVGGVDDFCRENHLDLFIFIVGQLDSPRSGSPHNNVLFDLISNRIVDGLILVPSTFGKHADRQRREQIVRRFGNMPVVTIGDRFEGIPSVGVDNLGGMKTLVDHLIEVHGHRRIAFIKGIEDNTEAESRYTAYRQSLANHGIAWEEDLICPGNFLFDAGTEAIKLLAERKVSYDAIVAANDNMAVGAMVELARQGCDAMAITGFDNDDGGKFNSLTTVDQPFRLQAYIAARVLFDLLNGRQLPWETLVPSDVVIRSSCGCLSPALSVLHSHQNRTGPHGLEAQQEFDAKLRQLALEFEPLEQQAAFLTQAEAMAKLIDTTPTPDFEARFSPAWKRLYRWTIRQGISVTILSSLLASYRNLALAKLGVTPRMIEMDQTFLGAETNLCELIETQSALRNIDSAMFTDEMANFGEALFRETDLTRQMQLIYDHLPGFGVRQGFIARYLNPDQPGERASPLLGFVEGRRCSLNEPFDTMDLIPQSFRAELLLERQTLVVQTLHCGDRRIGYLVTNTGDQIGRVLELIRYQLGVGIEGAMAVERLEAQVRERTRELVLANQRLSRSLNSNDMLLLELQHRVKNNLNVVASLLGLAASTIQHEEARKVLTDAQTRVYTMSGIYEQLYRKPELASHIELDSYLRNLTKSLFATYSISAEKVSLELEIAPFMLDMKRAISLGLIVNELVSNALKYAWPPGEPGRLQLRLRATRGFLELMIADDGRGLATDTAEGATSSLGLTIVHMLARELSAEMSVRNDGGTRIELRIPERVVED